MGELIKGLEDVVIARYLIVVAVTFQAYDYFTSLDDEIRLIWMSKIGVRHAQFFLNRYLPFATSLLALYYVDLSKDFKGCKPGFGSLVFTTVIGMLIAELTVFLRVDAVWGHKLSVRVILAVSYLLSSTVILYFTSIHLLKNTVVEIHFMSGCLYVHEDRMAWVALLAYTICEFVALSLLLTKAFLGYHFDNSPIMRNLYQDGIVYFSIITISSVANLVLLSSASPTLSDAFLVPESVLVNVLCSHMHLRIRKSHQNSLQSINESHGIELKAMAPFSAIEGRKEHHTEDPVSSYSTA